MQNFKWNIWFRLFLELITVERWNLPIPMGFKAEDSFLSLIEAANGWYFLKHLAALSPCLYTSCNAVEIRKGHMTHINIMVGILWEAFRQYF